MRKSILLVLTILLSWSGNAYATNLAVITSPPTILNLMVFLFACFCAVLCFQVFSLVKGGQLSRSWQMFLIAFVVLAITEGSILLGQFEVLALPLWVTPALTVLWVGIFVYGVFETKRVLC